MPFKSTKLKKEIDIRNIYTVFYFEFSKDYSFPGEAHDFWEMVYVDKGEITVTANDNKFILCQGDIIFHKPNEYHTLRSNGVIAPNIMVVSFECRSPAMKFFNDRVMSLSDEQKQLLSVILQESSDSFTYADDTKLTMLKKPDARFGSEQLIALSLMQLLISLRRSEQSIPIKPTSTLMERQSIDIAADVTEFLSENLDKKLRFSDITEFAGISASGLKSIFRTRFKMGVMAYFRQMKIERAKSLIREGSYNMTQISALLGYDSIHEFSRSFKTVTNMSPSEYGMSVNNR